VFVINFIIQTLTKFANYAIIFKSVKFVLILIPVQLAMLLIIGLLQLKIPALACQDIMMMLDNNVFTVEYKVVMYAWSKTLVIVVMKQQDFYPSLKLSQPSNVYANKIVT
jgi:hypothetical protein